jgi:hypothetical protein
MTQDEMIAQVGAVLRDTLEGMAYHFARGLRPGKRRV